jgi:hypothetical protein
MSVQELNVSGGRETQVTIGTRDGMLVVIRTVTEHAKLTAPDGSRRSEVRVVETETPLLPTLEKVFGFSVESWNAQNAKEQGEALFGGRPFSRDLWNEYRPRTVPAPRHVIVSNY